MDSQPPEFSKRIRRFLRAFCPEDIYEEIEGDLIQRFHRDLKRHGSYKTKWRMFWKIHVNYSCPPVKGWVIIPFSRNRGYSIEHV
jgi:hypothetical protein